MDYKTILVHCNDKARLPRLLGPAVTLGTLFKAHLVGVSVTPPVRVFPAGMPGVADTVVLDEHCEAYRADNPSMKAAFEAAAGVRSVATEWREGEAGNGSVAETVLEHARTADLIIAAQAVPGWNNSWQLDIPDRLALESGRPVLIVPNEGAAPRSPGKRIVLAWNDSREAARAVFDALPLAKSAEKVLAVQFDPNDGSRRDAAAALCAALDRHGVRCESHLAESPDGDVGKALLAQCGRVNADLLVMGCYGHSRLREVVFGGATRHVLTSMALPVLMSH